MEEIPDLTSISLPCKTGYMDVLTGHAEAFFQLGKGKMLLKSKSGVKELMVESGSGHVLDDVVTVVTSVAESLYEV